MKRCNKAALAGLPHVTGTGIVHRLEGAALENPLSMSKPGTMQSLTRGILFLNNAGMEEAILFLLSSAMLQIGTFALELSTVYCIYD